MGGHESMTGSLRPSCENSEPPVQQLRKLMEGDVSDVGASQKLTMLLNYSDNVKPKKLYYLTLSTEHLHRFQGFQNKCL